MLLLAESHARKGNRTLPLSIDGLPIVDELIGEGEAEEIEEVEDGIHRGKSADSTLIVILSNMLKESIGVLLDEAVEILLIALPDLFQPLIVEFASIPEVAPYVRHIDPREDEKLLLL